MRTLIVEPEHYSKEAVEIYRSFGDVVMEKTLSRVELLKAVRDAEILVIRLAHKIDREVLDAASKLKIIACPTTGLDHIDLAVAEEKGVRVISLKGETEFLRTIHATAEHTFALLLALLRRVPWAFSSVQAGEWDRDSYKGNELAGKTIGVIGFGRLGSRVAKIAQGFDMTVIATDPHVTINPTLGVRQVELNELLSVSDIISVHVPYTPETERMISMDTFVRMCQRALFINTSRGQVVDEAALLDALKSGKLAGAALDVIWAEERRPVVISGDPLVEYAKTHQNLLITPHLGGATFESMAKTEIFIAEKVRSLLDAGGNSR